jgi:chromosome partitioning protein
VTVILAIANHNGGVGKTVTAANVAAGFARAGRRTLAVDCDPQAHLTRWLLDPADQDAADLEAIVASGADPAAAVHPTRVAGLDALPATPRLADITRAWPPTAPSSPGRWGGCGPATTRSCWTCRPASAA